MSEDLADIECVACGYAIKFNQRAGFTTCGHGNIHYNCSYLGINCEVCNRPLMYDINQAENDFLSFEMNNKTDNNNSDGSEMYNLLSDIKNMLLEVKIEQSKQAKMIEDLKDEVKLYRANETKIHDLQTDILQIKLDKVIKDQKELEDKFLKLTCND